DLNDLSRSELQGLCKKLNIRAVGRTNELVSRLSEALAHELQGTGGASLDGSSSTSRRNRLAARDILPELAMGGANDGYSRGSSERTPPGPPDLSTLDQVRPSFANLSEEQWTQVRRLGLLLVEWNERVNLISRKDIGNVMQNHVVPCLAMAKALGLED
ncbi:unnamed protein product, partial [Sphacelaria rigidula]